VPATALGWLEGSWLATLTPVMILVGLGHSVLAMSGEETLEARAWKVPLNLRLGGKETPIGLGVIALTPFGRCVEDALVMTAQRLKSDMVVMGVSAKADPAGQAKAFGDAWERLGTDRRLPRSLESSASPPRSPRYNSSQPAASTADP
jgi:hypothetical protein